MFLLPSVAWLVLLRRLERWFLLFGREPVDFRHLGGIQPPIARRDILITLLRRARPRNHAAEERLRQQPAEVQLKQRAASLGAERAQSLDHAEIFVVEETFGVALVRHARAGR